MRIFAAIAFFALVLAGCSVGPNYHRPAALPHQPLPKAFTVVTSGTNTVTWKVAEPASDVPRGSWWQVFSNAELDSLEQLALTNNQNLVSLEAQLEQARQEVNVARSELYPQLTAGGG